MSDAGVRGRFVWHELMTTDTDAAAAFYCKVIGWKTQLWQQDPSYTMFVAEAGPMAGLMVLPEEARSMGAPPHWLTYIGTPNIAETTRRAGEMGAQILHGPMDVPGVGQLAVVRDPLGVVFAAFQPQGDPKDDGKPTLGDFSWHELATTDWQAAWGFYESLFGWEKKESMDMGPGMGVYQMFGRGDVTLGGMFNQPAHMPGPHHWLPYILVPDSKRVADAVAELGGRVLNGPMEVPGGDWVVQGMDPHGAVFAVHSLNPAAASSGEHEPGEERPEEFTVPESTAPQGTGLEMSPASMKPAKKRAAAKKAAAKPAAPAKKSAAGKPAAKKAAAKPKGKKPAAKKAATGKPTKKAAGMKRAAARPAGKKPGRKKAAGKKAVAKKAVARKAGAKKAAARKTAKKRVSKRPAAAKKTARKAAPKKSARKAAGKTARKAVKKVAKKPIRKSAKSGAKAKSRK